eukprot:COSAG04_NODE_9805_length_831_cov_0.770492_1_plen_97_part_00
MGAHLRRGHAPQVRRYRLVRRNPLAIRVAPPEPGLAAAVAGAGRPLEPLHTRGLVQHRTVARQQPHAHRVLRLWQAHRRGGRILRPKSLKTSVNSF